MGDTWITDMRHYLDDTGSLPRDIPNRALMVARFLGSIVGWVNSHPPGKNPRTNVPCRRSPGRRRSSGDIHARYQALAIKALRRGEISIGRFAEYLGISRQQAMRYVEQEATDNNRSGGFRGFSGKTS